jgi:hypothetical protein
MRMFLRQHLLILLMGLSVLGLTACAAARQDGYGSQSNPTSGNQTAFQFDCAGADSDPIGQSIAETYDTSYEQVMIWLCDGYSFDNILIALETSEAVDIPAETLLEMLLEKEWEEIWDEVGFVKQ